MAADQTDATSLAAETCLFRSLGDPSRLSVLTHLMVGEQRVVDLTRHLGPARSTVPAHLRCLLDCGLVEVRAQGRSSICSLTAAEKIRGLLRAAEDLLSSAGAAVVLCPVYGLEAAR